MSIEPSSKESKHATDAEKKQPLELAQSNTNVLMLEKLVKKSQPLKSNAKLLILGGGYSGETLAQLFRALRMPVLCTRRNVNSFNADLVFDSKKSILPNPEDLKGITHVLSTIPPSTEGNDPVLTCLLQLLKELPLEWVGYLSTTGVYGDSLGAWVNERSPTKPGPKRSQRRLSCENDWITSSLPIQILRLPGIYGPTRSILDGLRQRKTRLIIKPNQVFCRIHVEDIAGACLHLMHQSASGQRPLIVNIADNCPAPNDELVRFGCKLLGIKCPTEEFFEQISPEMSEMARSFWTENRRVSNKLLCNQLGYQLLHADYLTGLRDILRHDNLLKATLSE